MGDRLRVAVALAELFVAAALLGGSRRSGGKAGARYVTVGFAAGFLYRHAQRVAAGGTVRSRPGRTLSVTLAWTALSVAVDRSAADAAGRRAFCAGVSLGSVGYRAVRSTE